MAIFSIELYSFARFSQIPAAGGEGGGGIRQEGGGFGLVTGSLRCLIERESYPAVLEGQKLLHKRCMDINCFFFGSVAPAETISFRTFAHT